MVNRAELQVFLKVSNDRALAKASSGFGGCARWCSVKLLLSGTGKIPGCRTFFCRSRFRRDLSAT